MEKVHKFKTLKSAFREIEQIGDQNPTIEACGFIGFDEQDESFIVKQEDNSEFFLIDPINYLLFKDKYEMVGVFHSHMIGDEQPSEFDIKMAENCCLPFLIYSLNTKKIHIYEPQKVECTVNILRRMKALV